MFGINIVLIIHAEFPLKSDTFPQYYRSMKNVCWLVPGIHMIRQDTFRINREGHPSVMWGPTRFA